MIPTLSTARLALTLAGAALAAALLLTLVTQWMSRGQEIARLKEWQSSVVIATTTATVEPDAKGVRKTLTPETVPSAIYLLHRNYVGAADKLRELSATTEAAELRAAHADKALATATVVFEQRYSSAEKRIAALDSRKPAGNPAQQCVNVTADSKAAWEGWK